MNDMFQLRNVGLAYTVNGAELSAHRMHRGALRIARSASERAKSRSLQQYGKLRAFPQASVHLCSHHAFCMQQRNPSCLMKVSANGMRQRCALRFHLRKGQHTGQEGEALLFVLEDSVGEEEWGLQ